VLRVVDTNNSFKEATVGFWRAVIGKTMGAIRSTLFKKLDASIDSATKSVVNANASDAASKPSLNNMVATGAVVASVGVVAVHIPASAALIAVTGGAVTEANVIDYLATKPNKAPFYHASGVTVNRDDPVLY
jgi:hypothetical protein